MANRLSEGTVFVGDLALDRAKLDKAVRVRLGTGGVAISGSSEITCTGIEAVLPSQALVYDAFLNVITASTGATKSISVGLLSTSSGGSRTGFLNSISVASTGIVRPRTVAATSGPGTGGKFYATNTYGNFLSTFTSGSTSAGDPGYFNQQTFPTDSVTAKTLSYTPDSTDFIAFSADLFIFYTDLTK